MKHICFGLFFLISLLACSCNHPDSGEKDYTRLVDPFIGTLGSGNTFLGPVMPYGMVQLGPYLKYSEGGDAGTILGFSHTHVSGMAGGGNGNPGEILFMPVIENTSGNPKNVYQSGFLHRNESAAPGYYKVFLDDFGIIAELTSTTRTGLHKYTFPETDSAAVVLKLGNGSVTVNGNEVSGYCNNRVFFVAVFSKPFKSYKLSNVDKTDDGNQTLKGENVKVVFRFDTDKNEPILLKVGISMVSVEGAGKNLKTELPGWNFDEVRDNAKKAWK